MTDSNFENWKGRCKSRLRHAVIPLSQEDKRLIDNLLHRIDNINDPTQFLNLVLDIMKLAGRYSALYLAVPTSSEVSLIFEEKGWAK